MRARTVHRFTVCAAVSMAMACLSLPGALAAPPTTPAPTPEDPDQPPFSVPPPATQPSPVVADAGTGLGLLRILPNSAEGESRYKHPEFNEKLPEQAFLEFGMGLAVAQANSEALLDFEQAIAESRPTGFAWKGYAPVLPGTVIQTAVPDHAKPTTGGMHAPESKFLSLGGYQASAHARWDKRRGPCVNPISEAKNTLTSMSALNVLPSLRGSGGLLSQAPGLDAATTAALRKQLSGMAPLARLGGLLDGPDSNADGTGSLISIPGAIRAHSSTNLVDVPGQETKAVQAVSEFRTSSIRLFAGTSQQIRIDLAAAPVLAATATGNPETSSVKYTAPVLRVFQGGKELFTLDSAHPTATLPIGIPLPDSPVDSDVPLVGSRDVPRVVNIAVLKLELGELRKEVSGNTVKAHVRMLDITLLPAEPLGLPNALARLSLGEQFVRAIAPPGGADCDIEPPAGAAPVEPASQEDADTRVRAIQPLAKTGGAYNVIPLFWTGAILLLLGGTLLAALPRRR